MYRFSLLPLVAVLGCNPSDDGPAVPTDTGGTDTGIDTITTPPDPPTWQVENQFGNLVAVHTLESRQKGVERFDVQAVFAKGLDGYVTAAGCMVENDRGICLETLPTQPDTWVDNDPDFDLERNYTWNGFEIGVDTVFVPFINDLQREVQWYSFGIDAPPLEENPVVTFSGEWGDYTGNDLVVPNLELLEPAPTDNIDVTDGFGTIRWNPGGKGDMYVRIVEGSLHRVYLLEDDGEYELDWEELDLNPGDEPDVSVGRWSVKEVDVNGNSLTLVGITEQPCGTQLCDDFPVSNVTSSVSGVNLGDQPHFLGVGTQALIYDSELHDFNANGGVQSAALLFTIYDIAGAPLCGITYDASDYTIVQWPTDNGLPLWQGWSIDLVEGQGASTCGRVDAAVYGTDDLRDFVEQYDWGFGIGEMSAEFATALSDQFDPAQWAILQPQLHSIYVTTDGLTASEMSYGRNIDLSGCYTADANNTPDEEVPSGPNLPDSVYYGFPLYTIDIHP